MWNNTCIWNNTCETIPVKQYMWNNIKQYTWEIIIKPTYQELYTTWYSFMFEFSKLSGTGLAFSQALPIVFKQVLENLQNF